MRKDGVQELRLATYPPAEATHEEVCADRHLFVETHVRLMHALGIVVKVTTVAGQTVDLWKLYKLVTAAGGLSAVIAKKLWVSICEPFNFRQTFTNRSFVMKKVYVNSLHHYEQIYFLRNTGPPVAPPSTALEQEAAALQSYSSLPLPAPAALNPLLHASAFAQTVPASSPLKRKARDAPHGTPSRMFGSAAAPALQTHMSLPLALSLANSNPQAFSTSSFALLAPPGIPPGTQFTGTIDSCYDTGYVVTLHLATGQRIHGALCRRADASADTAPSAASPGGAALRFQRSLTDGLPAAGLSLPDVLAAAAAAAATAAASGSQQQYGEGSMYGARPCEEGSTGAMGEGEESMKRLRMGSGDGAAASGACVEEAAQQLQLTSASAAAAAAAAAAAFAPTELASLPPPPPANGMTLWLAHMNPEQLRELQQHDPQDLPHILQDRWSRLPIPERMHYLEAARRDREQREAAQHDWAAASGNADDAAAAAAAVAAMISGDEESEPQADASNYPPDAFCSDVSQRQAAPLLPPGPSTAAPGTRGQATGSDDAAAAAAAAAAAVVAGSLGADAGRACRSGSGADSNCNAQQQQQQQQAAPVPAAAAASLPEEVSGFAAAKDIAEAVIAAAGGERGSTGSEAPAPARAAAGAAGPGGDSGAAAAADREAEAADVDAEAAALAMLSELDADLAAAGSTSNMHDALHEALHSDEAETPSTQDPTVHSGSAGPYGLMYHHSLPAYYSMHQPHQRPHAHAPFAPMMMPHHHHHMALPHAHAHAAMHMAQPMHGGHQAPGQHGHMLMTVMSEVIPTEAHPLPAPTEENLFLAPFEVEGRSAPFQAISPQSHPNNNNANSAHAAAVQQQQQAQLQAPPLPEGAAPLRPLSASALSLHSLPRCSSVPLLFASPMTTPRTTQDDIPTPPQLRALVQAQQAQAAPASTPARPTHLYAPIPTARAPVIPEGLAMSFRPYDGDDDLGVIPMDADMGDPCGRGMHAPMHACGGPSAAAVAASSGSDGSSHQSQVAYQQQQHGASPGGHGAAMRAQHMQQHPHAAMYSSPYAYHPHGAACHMQPHAQPQHHQLYHQPHHSHVMPGPGQQLPAAGHPAPSAARSLWQ